MTQTPLNHKPLAAIGFSAAALPLLRQLEQAREGLLIRWPHGEDSPEAWLAEQWPRVSGLVAIGACGLVTRLVAPLLTDKRTDPAVVVIDPLARWVVPLVGGHQGGGKPWPTSWRPFSAARRCAPGPPPVRDAWRWMPSAPPGAGVKALAIGLP